MTKSYYRTLAVVVTALVAGGGILYGIGMAASVLIGGGLAFLNARWTAAGLDLVLGREGREKLGSVMVRFLGRLLLIFGTLFAIIHTSFLSVLGVVAGLSAGVVSAVIEEFRHLTWKGR